MLYVSIVAYVLAFMTLVGILQRERKRRSHRRRISNLLAIDASREPIVITRDRLKCIVNNDRLQEEKAIEKRRNEFPVDNLISLIAEAKIKLQDDLYRDFMQQTEKNVTMLLNYELGKGAIRNDNKKGRSL